MFTLNTKLHQLYLFNTKPLIPTGYLKYVSFDRLTPYLSPIVIGPLIEVVADIKCPVVVGCKLIVYQDHRVAVSVILPHLGEKILEKLITIERLKKMQLYRQI